MVKRFYQVGEPCDICNTPTIASKKGGSAYCWPCWSKWKDAQKAPQTQQIPHAVANLDYLAKTPPQASGERTERIIELLTSIDEHLAKIADNSLKDEDGNKIPF